MKKALKFLGVAAVAALLLAGCQTGTTSTDSSLNTGTTNHDFNGKTLVYTYTGSYITKHVETTVDTTGVETAVVTKIPLTTVTNTIIFASDTAKTFTATTSTVYADTANGDYRATSYDNGTTTVDVYYDGGYDFVIAGLAGLTAADSVTYNGNWRTVDQLESPIDGQTLEYFVSYTSKVTTSVEAPTYTQSAADTLANTTGTNKKYTYKASAGSTTTTLDRNGYTDELTYQLAGTTSAGKEIFNLKLYTGTDNTTWSCIQQ